jgi:hypothetical protein
MISLNEVGVGWRGPGPYDDRPPATPKGRRMDVSAALRLLLAGSVHARPDDLPALIDGVAGHIDATAITIYMADLRQRALIPLGPARGENSENGEIAIDGTLGGRAFRLGEPQHGPADEAAYWLPLCNGAERLGVLRIVAAGDAETIPAYAELANQIAAILTARRATGDMIERVRRREPMRVPAELIRSQLPPLAFATSHAVISGVLEPCYAVGGDAFDYAVNGDTVHVALFDAVGHGAHSSGLRAAVLATVALAAYRNAAAAGWTWPTPTDTSTGLSATTTAADSLPASSPNSTNTPAFSGSFRPATPAASFFATARWPPSCQRRQRCP